MFTDGPQLGGCPAGYPVVWKKSQTWVGVRTHIGYNQEAYDAECAALARALEAASRRPTSNRSRFSRTFEPPSDGWRRNPGPGQQYAPQARKHIATLRRARPEIVEIRWCPAQKGVAGNEKADEWAKIAAEEPDTRGVEWLSYLDQAGARAMPLPISLAHLKREISEKKWAGES